MTIDFVVNFLLCACVSLSAAFMCFRHCMENKLIVRKGCALLAIGAWANAINPTLHAIIWMFLSISLIAIGLLIVQLKECKSCI